MHDKGRFALKNNAHHAFCVHHFGCCGLVTLEQGGKLGVVVGYSTGKAPGAHALGTAYTLRQFERHKARSAIDCQQGKIPPLSWLTRRTLAAKGLPRALLTTTASVALPTTWALVST